MRWCETEIEPLVDRAVKLGLAAGEQVTHALDAHGGLRLQPGKLDKLLVGGFRVVPAQRPHGNHDQGGQQREPREHDHDRSGEGSEVVHHARMLHRFAACEQKGT